MKTVTYPLRLAAPLYQQVQNEAKRRHKQVADLFREIIGYGLEALPPVPDYEAAQAAWDSLGPAPEVIYDKLPEKW